MPAEDAKILVIDDHGSLQEGGSWVTFCEKYDVACHLLVAENKEAIRASLIQMFEEEPNRAFVGTVLDVIFRGQPRGGLDLWEQLIDGGLAARCGHLLVTTKQESEEVTEFTRRHNAILNTRLTLPHKEAAFRKLLRRCTLIQ